MAFDVFLSYSRTDESVVETIATALRERGVRPFLDRWYLTAGRDWQKSLLDQLAGCGAIAVFLGSGGIGGWQQREISQALIRQTDVGDASFPVIPVLLPGNDDPALGFLSQNTWIDLREGFTDSRGLDVLALAIKGSSPGTGRHWRDPRQEICPYRGLNPFREEDAAFFKGRNSFTTKLAEAVGKQRVVAVVGASGSGKSSVVRAGLVPVLRKSDGGHWDVLTLTPGAEPLTAFVSAMDPPDQDLGLIERRAALNRRTDLISTGGVTAGELVLDRLTALSESSDRTLLVVDQWEELYTLASKSGQVELFLDQLLNAVETSPLTVVLTLRGDFYGRALEDRRLADQLQDAVVNIGPMNREELEAAIVEPAAQTGLHFEDGLVDTILNDVGSEPGNLPLLEFLLTELWKHRDRDGTLRHQAYQEVGRVQGAIAKRAEDEFTGLSQEERKACERLMIRLVAIGEGRADTRARLEWPEGDSPTEAVIEKFAGPTSRLLVAGRDDRGDRRELELSHEALIREWARLGRWIEANRDDLRVIDRIRRSMKAWMDENDPNAKSTLLLPPGRPLEEARELLARADEKLVDDIAPFVQASIAKDERRLDREKKRQQTLRKTALAAGVAAVIALGASVFAWVKKNDADVLTSIAEDALAEVRSNLWDSLINQAGLSCRSRTATGRGLGLSALEEAARIRVGPELDDTIVLCLEQIGLKHRDDPNLRVAADRGRSELDRPHSLDGPSPAQEQRNQRVSESQGYVANFRNTERQSDYEIAIEKKGEAGDPWRLSIKSDNVTDIQFHPTEPILAVSVPDFRAGHKVKLFDIAARTKIADFQLDEGFSAISSAVYSGAVQFSRSGRYLAAGGAGGRVRVWDLENSLAQGRANGLLPDRPLFNERVFTRAANLIAFSPSEDLIAIASNAGEMQLWAFHDGIPVIEGQGVRMSPGSRIDWIDARTLVTGGEVWEVDRPAQTVLRSSPSFALGGGGIEALRFSDAEELLAVGSEYQIHQLVYELSPPFAVHSGTTAVNTGHVLLFTEGDSELITFDLSSRSIRGIPDGVELSTSTDFTRTVVSASQYGEDDVVLAGSRSAVSVKLLNLDKGEILWETSFPGVLLGNTSPTFSVDGTRVAASFNSGSSTSTRIWQVDTGDLKRTVGRSSYDKLFAHTSGIAGLSGEGLRLYHIEEEEWSEAIRDQPLNRASSSSYVGSYDGSRIAESRPEGDIVIWDFEAKRRLTEIERSGSPERELVKFSPNNEVLGVFDGSVIYVWRADSGDLVGSIEIGAKTFEFLGEENELIRIVTNTGEVFDWTVGTENKELVTKLSGWQISHPYSPVFLRRKGDLVIRIDESRLKTWDVFEGTIVTESSFSAGSLATSIRSISVNHDGTLAVSVSEQSEIGVWSIEAPDMFVSLSREDRRRYVGYRNLRLVTGDRLLVWGANEQGEISLILFDLTANQTVFSANLDDSPSCVAATALAEMIAVCSADKILLYDRSGEYVGELLLPSSRPIDAAFDAQGNFLAVMTADGGIAVWDPKTQKRMFSISTSSADLSAIALSKTGRWLSVGDSQGRIRLWNIRDLMERIGSLHSEPTGG